MRTNMRCSRAADLTREVVPLQCRTADLIHARLVTPIERDVQAHPQSDRQQPLPANAQKEGGKRSYGAVEHPRRRVLWRVGLIEEAHRRQRVPATLSQTEPRVVVNVDENASRPEAQGAAAEPWVQQRGARGGERDVISNSHHTLQLTRLTA
jgi:hypothetical protein